MEKKRIAMLQQQKKTLIYRNKTKKCNKKNFKQQKK